MPKAFATPEDYLQALPPERRKEIAATRKLVNQHLPKGYAERQDGGFISWEIPIADYPSTYNKKPLCYIGLAAQKNYNALYLVGCYMSEAQKGRIEAAYEAAGRKIDMGKSCLRFSTYEELPHEVLGELIAEMTPAEYIDTYEKARAQGRP